MLWRPTYETRILHRVVFPSLVGRFLDGEQAVTPTDGAILSAFGPLAGAELGVWRRLLEEAGQSAPTVLVQAVWTSRERRAIADATAPSLHSRTLLAEDPEGVWAGLVQPDRPGRAFGAVLRGGVADPLMAGLPTEEAWDDFVGSLGRRVPPTT